MIDDHDWESTAPVLDDTLRRLAPRSCVGHCEREPGRLQLRFVVDVDEHMHDIVVVEEDDTVVVSAVVCTPTTGVWREQFEGPFHVYLDEPLRRAQGHRCAHRSRGAIQGHLGRDRSGGGGGGGDERRRSGEGSTLLD